MPQAGAYLVELILAALGIEDGRLVAIVEQVASRDEAVTPCFPDQPSLETPSHIVGLIPLFPGPQATRTRFPLSRGWTRNTAGQIR